eukprot:TRINITY_DN76725_c0_g1_i1.p1 TRINITY_DN76725_c0_g1~~TRINITY_DN76725_c0_g1_i1.p1  ORF type:complete len:133 (+),score=20.23 TRINITY_DN76725_c0_g1_i1:122-520(+)
MRIRSGEAVRKRRSTGRSQASVSFQEAAPKTGCPEPPPPPRPAQKFPKADDDSGERHAVLARLWSQSDLSASSEDLTEHDFPAVMSMEIPQAAAESSDLEEASDSEGEETPWAVKVFGAQFYACCIHRSHDL